MTNHDTTTRLRTQEIWRTTGVTHIPGYVNVFACLDGSGERYAEECPAFLTQELLGRREIPYLVAEGQAPSWRWIELEPWEKATRIVSAGIDWCGDLEPIGEFSSYIKTVPRAVWDAEQAESAVAQQAESRAAAFVTTAAAADDLNATAPAPAGIDKASWRAMPADARRAILAAMASVEAIH